MSARFPAILLSLSLVRISPVLAQAIPLGNDFPVVSFTDARPSAAAGPAGTFVVVWADENGDGSGKGVTGRLFTAVQPQGGQLFQVNTYTSGYQDTPAVAFDAAGNFLVVWYSDGSFGSDNFGGSIQAQRYDAGGVRVGNQFQVNNFTTGAQTDPVVAADAGGTFTVVWRSIEIPELDEAWRVHARRFGTGPPQFQFEATEGRVSLFAPVPKVAVNTDGVSFFVWNAGRRIRGRLYDPFGNPLAGEFQVNTYTTNYQRPPAITADGAGNFVVVWPDTPLGANFGNTRGRRYDRTGTPIGDEFGVGPETNEQRAPAVAADGAGNFIVVWERENSEGSENGTEIVGQLYSTLGTPLGEPFQVNSYGTSDQRNPAIVADDSGTFTALWSGGGVSGGIDGRRFVVPTTTSTSTTSTTLPGPVCGNGVVEPGEACDGGACCAPGCVLRGPTEPCGIATQVCHEQPLCNGREATCPDIPRLSPEGSTCFNPEDGCVIGICRQATASCEAQAQVCAVQSQVLNDGRVRKNGRPRVKIMVSCDANQEGECEAAAFTTSAGPQALVLEDPAKGELITEPIKPSRTHKHGGKRKSLRFRTVIKLKLNARGRELLAAGDLPVTLRARVRRGSVDHYPPAKILRLLQLRR